MKQLVYFDIRKTKHYFVLSGYIAIPVYCLEIILSHIFMDTQLLVKAFLRIRTLDKLFEVTIALVNFRICN